ncbi:DUF2339 domain-containing protein [Pelagibaculum spongiae]|uniref:DUF2339 domain-containing protein n=1 Tax=Pelagibaculum spongiae TaxID=2080658 RepID=A0A2V1GX68_9GAMM|nr:DUF2339 domain-containing protein [Pelagibaculum spongiae]PVZ66285.1 hypothetical protein DC094_16405 [Pelagibaculum spongiae]
MNNNDIDALKSELSQIKAQFTDRIDRLETKINEFTEPDITSKTNLANNVASSAVTSVIDSNAPPSPLPNKARSATIASNPVEVEIPKEPSAFEMLFSTLMSTIFDWFTPVTKIYQSYKDRGMLGIFILTLAGIGLTLAGFGYLMQLLIDQLGAGAKSLLIFAGALSVIGIGIVLKKKTSFHEFAAAIVSLGLLLLYSTVYFAGSVYNTIPYTVVVMLYLLIALSSHAITLWLDTKTVAALGIAGIALMPIISNITVAQPSYYLVSLLFVTISSLIISYRYVGPWLANLSLAFVLMALEWVIGVNDTHLSALFINLFYLIFFSYVSFNIIKNSNTQQQSLLFLAALVGTNLLFLIQATSLFSDSVSVVFAANALITAATGYIFYKIKHALTHFIILVAAIWAAFAIVSAISQAYWGIAWAVEGLFLLYLGRRHTLPMVINQGQLLAAISLTYGAMALIPYFPLPALTSIDGWTLSISLALIMGIWLRLIDGSKPFDLFTMQKIKPLLQLLESVWLAVLLISSSDIWLGTWTAPLVLLLQFTLLLRATACKQASIEIFAALLVLVPVIYVLQIAVTTNSFHFYSLPVAAKCAVISVLTQLWLFAEYYRRFQPNSTMVKVAEGARIAFYLIIPICWFGSAIRHLEEYVLMVSWLPPMIALFFAQKIKHEFIVWQAKILVGLASALLILGLSFLPNFAGIITLGLFMICYGVAFLLNKHSANSMYRYVFICGLFALGLAWPVWLVNVNGDMVLAMLFAALYWGGLFNLVNIWSYAKRLTLAAHLISCGLILGSWLLLSDSLYYVLVPIIYIAAALYQKEQRFKFSMVGEFLGENSELSLHVIGVITYTCLLVTLTSYRMDILIAPVLAVHGALILFLKDRRLTTVKFSFGLIFLGIMKLALIDAENVLLWQKVMLFMGIGIFILAATFWYQKIIKRSVNDVAEDDAINS